MAPIEYQKPQTSDFMLDSRDTFFRFSRTRSAGNLNKPGNRGRALDYATSPTCFPARKPVIRRNLLLSQSGFTSDHYLRVWATPGQTPLSAGTRVRGRGLVAATERNVNDIDRLFVAADIGSLAAFLPAGMTLSHASVKSCPLTIRF